MSLRTGRLLWLGLSTIVLIAAYLTRSLDVEAGIALGWFAILCGFPSSLLGMTISAMPLGAMENSLSDRTAAALYWVPWATIMLFGYIQWFVLLPRGIGWLERWAKARKGGSRAQDPK